MNLNSPCITKRKTLGTLSQIYHIFNVYSPKIVYVKIAYHVAEGLTLYCIISDDLQR